MKLKYKLILALILLLVSGVFIYSHHISAEQTLKTIEIPIGFVPSMIANNDYIQTITLNSPDGIDRIISMEVLLKGDFIASTNITSRVRQTGTTTLYSCNPHSLKTPHSIANNYEVGFDCSNLVDLYDVINKTIDLGFRTNRTATNVRAYLRITYVNNPKGSMSLSGTEYSPNDPATAFVQLRDSFGNSIQNGSCYLDIYSPNITKTQILFNAPMIEVNGDDGLYYYDLSAPSELGVYMLSAKCSYSYNWQWFFREDDIINYPITQTQTGTCYGNSSSLNKLDNINYFCEDIYVGNYTFNLSSYGNLTSITNINNYLYVSSDDSGDTITIAYLLSNNTWVNLANTLTTTVTATTTEPFGYPQLLTNNIPISAIVNGSIKLRITTTFGQYFFDKFSIALLSSTGSIQELKGNSEMHITNIANASLNAILNNTQIVENIWNYSNRSLTYYPDINYTKIVEDVWSYASRNLTYFPTQIDLTNYTKVSDFVWNYLNKNLTYYNMTDTTNYTKIVNDVWTYGNRNLTYFPPQIDLTNYSLITQNVWNYGNRNLTYFPAGNNITVGDIWAYVNRNLTWFPTQNNITTQDIWTYFNRSLTYFPYNNISSADIWSYFNRNLTYFPTQNNITSGDIWSYFNRSLTEFNFDVVNETAIAESVWSWNGVISNNILSQLAQYIWNWVGSISSTIGSFFSTGVWNYSARNLTYTDDVTNYTTIQNLITQYGNTDNVNYTLVQDLISQYGNNDNTNYSAIYSGVWMFSNRSLSEFNFIVNTTINLSEVSDYVWNNANRTLTFYNNSQQLDLTNYSQIVYDTWNYYNRTLTFYNNSQQLDLTNYSQIVYDTWNYYNRSLTDYNISDLTNYTAIFEGVWLFNNRSLTEFNFDLMSNLNITQIAEGVWYYSDRNLTYFPAPIINNLTAADVWAYVNRTLSYYELANLTASDIWNYTNRTLTYYLPGNNITANEIWNFVNRNLTYYLDMTNYSKINQGVWSYSNRTLYFLYPNGTTGPQPSGTGKLPLSNIEISTPDPFYFNTDYIIYYDPIDIKGATVEVSGISVKILENITYTSTTPTIMTDGRYKQTLKILEQDISSFTLDVNMTQSFIVTNQKSFTTIDKKKAGITGFVVMDDTAKRNIVWVLLLLLFLLFMIIIIGVVSKNRKEKHKSRY